MSQGHGNQHASRKRDLLAYLSTARIMLLGGRADLARKYLMFYRERYTKAPASSRRRWRCGQ